MDFEYANALNQAMRLLTLRHRGRAGELLSVVNLHPGQEVLLLELAKGGPMIQAALSRAVGSEPPSVTHMTRKLESVGHVSRRPSPTDRRVSIVELTDVGSQVVHQVRRLWEELAGGTIAGLPRTTAADLPGLLETLIGNLDEARPQRPSGRPPASP